MTIATLNINWALHHSTKILSELIARDFDILVLTETVPIDLPAYEFVYASKALPIGPDYEGMNYSKFTKGANRIAIYSKYPSIQQYSVSDDYTSCCHAFETEIGKLTIFATIVGTLFRKLPYAQIELDNCINDCTEIAKQTDSLCLIGDLNTSFLPDEKLFQINELTTQGLRDLCSSCQLELTTAHLKNNIDHIFLPQHLEQTYNIQSSVFVEKGVLSDHQGLCVEIQRK